MSSGNSVSINTTVVDGKKYWMPGREENWAANAHAKVGDVVVQHDGRLFEKACVGESSFAMQAVSRQVRQACPVAVQNVARQNFAEEQRELLHTAPDAVGLAQPVYMGRRATRSGREF